MGGTRVFLAPTLLAVLLAGCTGDQPGGQVGVSSQPPAPEPSVTTDMGAISGLVTDDESLPIAAVKVGVMDGGGEVQTTDAEGKFTFSGLAPGDYRLAFEKLGYESLARGVQVIAGSVSDVSVVLKPIQVATEPLIVMVEKKGYIQCSMSAYYATNHCGEPLGQDEAKFPFQVDPALGYEEAVFELVWTPATAGTGQELEIDVCIEQDQTTNVVNCVADGTYFEYASGLSPQVLRLTDLPVKDTTRFEVDIGSGYLSPYPTIQQSFTLYVTLCYVEKCAEDYTAIPK